MNKHALGAANIRTTWRIPKLMALVATEAGTAVLFARRLSALTKNREPVWLKADQNEEAVGAT